jgi:hypothetical protein
MPNHCSNRLTVSGEPEEVCKFVSFAKPDPSDDKRDAPLDYAKLCPMPDDQIQQLLEGDSGHLADLRRRLPFGSQLTPLEEFKLLQESTNPDDVKKAEHLLHEAWYHWCVEAWGTKWNCYDGSIDESRVEEDGIVVYHFDSAWSPPLGVIRAAAEKFNTLTFKLEYAEPGCDFSGVFEAIGDVYDDECYNSVLETEYGQEMYQESFDEQAREEAEEKAEEERLKNAEDQDNCNT